eukprot:11442554-Prorocentrum_lima.AAC.1
MCGPSTRHAHQPHNLHLEIINRALRYCKSVNTGMLYKKLAAPMCMAVVADVACRSNDDLKD